MKKIFINVLIIVVIALNIPMNTLCASENDVDIIIGMNTAVGNIYEQGTAGFSVYISNSGNTDVSINVSYSVSGETYKEYNFSDTGTINVAAGEKKETAFSLLQDKYGLYKLDVSVGTEKFSDTFAVIPHYSKQFLEEYTRRGIATQYERGGRTDSNDKILMDKAGVKHIRDGIIWTKHEKEKGLFDYSYTDLWYKNVSSDTHTLVMGLWYNNPFYNGGKSDKYGISGQYQIESYANYARNMARRYRGVSEFEIWNEPDYGSFWLPEGNAFDYVNMLKVASVEIKQINPDAGIAAGALSKTSETDFMRQVFEFGGYPYLDAVSIHPYVTPKYDADDEYSVSRYKSYMNLISEYGGWKDIIATEVGWPTHSGGASLERQAEQLVKQNVIADKYGLNANEWFSFRDAGMNLADKEDNFGVLKNDYSPKPAYIALCNLNRFLAGAVYCGELSWLNGAAGHLYMKDGMPVVIAWAKNQTISASEFGNDMKAFDIYGNKLTDISSLPSDGSPVYFVNIDDSMIETVLSQEIKNGYSQFLRNYESYIPQSVKTVIGSFSEISNKCVDEAADMLNTHYGYGINIIEEFSSDDVKLLSGMLYDWHRIGETIGKLYLKHELADGDITYNARREIRKMRYAFEAANNSNETDILPFSQAISKFAVRYCDKSIEVRKMEPNKMKYSYSKMCNDISKNLAVLAEELSQKEQGENTCIVISVPSKELALEGDMSGTKVTVKNYKKEEVTGKICLYSSDGTMIVSSDTVILMPLIGHEFTLEIGSEFYSKAADGYAQLYFVNDERAVAFQNIIFKIA